MQCCELPCNQYIDVDGDASVLALNPHTHSAQNIPRYGKQHTLLYFVAGDVFERKQRTFLRMLSQKLAMSSALVLPATFLQQSGGKQK
jgi:hypothetical protein